MSARDDAVQVKRPTTTAHIHELIAGRWSPRAFDARPLEPTVWRTLFEAARWAPSSSNEQPWRFVVVERTHATEFSPVVRCLNEGNQRWASGAAALVVTAVRRARANSDEPNPWAWHDLGQAIANLSLQATAHGVMVHQMAGFNAAHVRDVVGIPADYEPVTIVALGYLGDPEHLAEPDRVREMAPRQRLDVDAIVFRGRWQKRFDTL